MAWLFYIEESLKYVQSKKTSLNLDNVEDLWIELTRNKKSYLIDGIYRHSYNKAINIEKFSVNIHNLFQAFNSKKLSFCVVGDFNINLMQYTLNNSVRKYANCLLSCSTKCIINQPTRITAHTKTLLNHIYVISEQINVNAGIARLELADHLPTFALIPKIKDKTPKISPNFFKRDMKYFQMDLFLDDLNLKLNKISFEDFNVDESFENFLNIFADIVNTHAPLRKCTRKENKLKVKPWLNKILLKLIHRKNNMFKDLHKNFNQQSFDKYKAYRNVLNRTIQGAKQIMIF